VVTNTLCSCPAYLKFLEGGVMALPVTQQAPILVVEPNDALRYFLNDLLEEEGPLAEDWQAEGSWVAGGAEEDTFDPLSLLGDPVDFRIQLCLALRAQLPSDDAPLLEYLVEGLNDDGYLQGALEEVARLFRVPLERVEYVLAALQGLEPAGIGARTVRECLLLQVQALAEQGIQQPYAFEILDQYLPWLGQHHYREIARAVGCTLLQVEQVQVFLKRHLHPYPMRSAQAAAP
jgi:NADH:ubiquinone oxidoreductase subunit E